MDSGSYQWYPLPKKMPGSRFGLYLPLALVLGFEFEFLALNGPTNYLHILLFDPPKGDWGNVLIVYFILVLFGSMAPMSYLNQDRSIGVGPTGIAVQSRRRTQRVPWANLRGGFAGPKSDAPFAYFRYDGGAGLKPGGFLATKDAGRAILSNAQCPVRQFPPEYWQWSGLPDPVNVNRAPLTSAPLA